MMFKHGSTAGFFGKVLTAKRVHVEGGGAVAVGRVVELGMWGSARELGVVDIWAENPLCGIEQQRTVCSSSDRVFYIASCGCTCGR